ncbi:hypothetical protein [Priestia taiwanensis]|uniref:Uncharacterized protein n=1 Tax=Priestia taiwanensis TaxID=1347902 RepID=A0A917ETT0_9BACI|nr:hypothetical protein [Priestia taiwanensis]MBM7364479.1 hypothetical protein [Priestia taiwanensis]GGE81132.1 hypothetical protein GCM10007140_33380 [Priestia taiwanensis]
MFFDLLNDMLISSSMFYMYLSLLLVVIGMSYMFRLQQRNWVLQAQFYVNKHTNMKINRACIEIPRSKHESVMEWITLIFKRIDERDDKEADTSSYFNQIVKIRGGRTCLKTTYSPRLENIVF